MYSSCMHWFGRERVSGGLQTRRSLLLFGCGLSLFFFLFFFLQVLLKRWFLLTAWVILKSPIWNWLSLSKKKTHFYMHYLHGTAEKVLFCLQSTITDNIYWSNIIVHVIGSLRKARRHLQNISEAQIVSNVVSTATIKWQL